VRYRIVMTLAAVAMMLVGFVCVVRGDLLLEFYAVEIPPQSYIMSFFRLRSFLYLLGTLLFGFGLVTWYAKKIVEPATQRSIAIAHCYAFVLAGFIALSQQRALWDTQLGWITVEFFFVLAAGLGYLGFIALANAVPRHQSPLAMDADALRERWKREISSVAIQQERNRLARDLHDSIKQQIFTIGVSAAAAQARWESDPAGARSALDDVRGGAHEAMVEMEAMLQHLRPAPLETIGLVEALRKQCEALKYRTGAQMTSEFTDLPGNDRFPPGTQEAIFRIAQEVLANIARHARAQNVRVGLHMDAKNESLILQVQDDGQGFSPTTIKEGMGMSNIRARSREIGGQLNLWSEPGRGTRLTISIPLMKAGEQRAGQRLFGVIVNALVVLYLLGMLVKYYLQNRSILILLIPVIVAFLFPAICNLFEVRRIMQSNAPKLSWLRVLSKSLPGRW
jgi:signal transduction histidine kinase